MKLIKTKDNSFTFFNEEFQEHYHSISGALEEANKKFIEPLELKDGMTILDICFGLGYNTLAAIEKYKNLKIIANFFKFEEDGKVTVQKIMIEQTFPGFGFFPKPGRAVGQQLRNCTGRQENRRSEQRWWSCKPYSILDDSEWQRWR